MHVWLSAGSNVALPCASDSALLQLLAEFPKAPRCPGSGHPHTDVLPQALTARPPALLGSQTLGEDQDDREAEIRTTWSFPHYLTRLENRQGETQSEREELWIDRDELRGSFTVSSLHQPGRRDAVGWMWGSYTATATEPGPERVFPAVSVSSFLWDLDQALKMRRWPQVRCFVVLLLSYLPDSMNFPHSSLLHSKTTLHPANENTHIGDLSSPDLRGVCCCSPAESMALSPLEGLMSVTVKQQLVSGSAAAQPESLQGHRESPRRKWVSLSL